MRHVVHDAAAKYSRPVVVARALRPIGGGGLLLAEGADWRRQRKMLAPVFTPAAIGLLTPHFFAAAEHLMRRLVGKTKSNLSLDFHDTALEAALRALFSLSESDERERLGGMARRYLSSAGRPHLLDVFAPTENSFNWSQRGRRKFRARWREAVDALIETRQAQGGRAEMHDLLDLLLAARDAETGAPLSTAEIGDQCATLLVAGFETTARLMFWLSYLLALDKAEQEAIRAELSRFPPDKPENLDAPENWPRLRQAMLEALRLYPPAPHVVREAIADDVVCGQAVRPGDQIWISAWVIHRHRKYWDNPDAFIPDRFTGKPAPWSGGVPFMPFGAGPRICIGAAFAMAEAQIVLATFFARYRVSLADNRPVLPVGAVTISPNREPIFRLERV